MMDNLKHIHLILLSTRVFFDDSLVVSSMINNGIETLITLDTDFNKVSIIKARQP